MSASIQLPAKDQQCAYCGARIFDHDPICVRECIADCSNARYFCNYACLASYIEEEELTVGDSCSWEPTDGR